MRNNNSELLFDQTCVSQSVCVCVCVSGGQGGYCPLSWRRQTLPWCLITFTLQRTVIRYWFGLTRARRSSGLLYQPTVRRSVLPGALWGLLCKLYFSAVAALRRAAPWMLNESSPFGRHIVLLPDEAIISPSPPDSGKLIHLSIYAPLFFFFPLPSHSLFASFFFFFCSIIWEGTRNNATTRLPVISASVTENWMGHCGNCARVPLEKLRLLFQLLPHLCGAAVLVIIGRVPSMHLCFWFFRCWSKRRFPGSAEASSPSMTSWYSTTRAVSVTCAKGVCNHRVGLVEGILFGWLGGKTKMKSWRGLRTNDQSTFRCQLLLIPGALAVMTALLQHSGGPSEMPKRHLKTSCPRPFTCASYVNVFVRTVIAQMASLTLMLLDNFFLAGTLPCDWLLYEALWKCPPFTAPVTASLQGKTGGLGQSEGVAFCPMSAPRRTWCKTRWA